MNDSLTGPSPLGIVVGGSLDKGLEVKLDRAASLEEVKVGTYVAIQGEQRRFFGMITDVRLEALDPRLPASPPDVADPFIAQVLKGTSFYGTLEVRPMLTIGAGAEGILEGPQPVKTVPAHFSPVRLASAEDVELVFGAEDERHFYIGTPLEMEERVHLDLAALVQRSTGVFGKSGTGKTFLTRLLLLGIAQKKLAANLVFDMHNEYGWKGSSEGGRPVKGLKQLFPARTIVFSLDPESSHRRGVPVDHIVRIGYGEIDPDDIAVLAETLNLTEAGVQAAYRLERQWGRQEWLKRFLDLKKRDDLVEVSQASLEHEGTLQALHRRLQALVRFPFLASGRGNDSVGEALRYLDRGFHVVLEFGRFTDNLTAYMLVANLLTRRLHERYVERSERALGDEAQMPHPIVITIEEAHKFLNPQVASQTIFGTIAREMRKYNVTLLVVDQRPSGIDSEVMSQIGTKFACLLDDERDVEAVLSGVSGRSELRRVLARLESKQQALIFGHALPMPVVVRTREYGSAESYAEFGLREGLEARQQQETELKDLFG